MAYHLWLSFNRNSAGDRPPTPGATQKQAQNIWTDLVQVRQSLKRYLVPGAYEMGGQADPHGVGLYMVSDCKSLRNQSPKGIKWSEIPLPCFNFLGFLGGKQGPIGDKVL